MKRLKVLPCRRLRMLNGVDSPLHNANIVPGAF